MLFARVLFQVIAHELNGFEEIAVGPFLLGLFVVGIGHAFAFVVVNDSEGAAADQTRNVMGHHQPQSDQREHHSRAPAPEVIIGFGGRSHSLVIRHLDIDQVGVGFCFAFLHQPRVIALETPDEQTGAQRQKNVQRDFRPFVHQLRRA